MATIRERTIERIKPYEGYIIKGFKLETPSVARAELEVFVANAPENINPSIIISRLDDTALSSMSLARAYEYAMKGMMQELAEYSRVVTDAARRLAENYHQAEWSLENDMVDGDHWMMSSDQYRAAWELLTHDMFSSLSYTSEEIAGIWTEAKENIESLIESDNGGS